MVSGFFFLNKIVISARIFQQSHALVFIKEIPELQLDYYYYYY